MFVLTQPERYDVCVTTNMFGDILTDLASVLQGGMGMAVGCNVGDDHAMFRADHGSAPPLAGKDRANPMAMMLATGEAMGGSAAVFRRPPAPRACGDRSRGGLARRAGEPLTSDLAAARRSRSSPRRSRQVRRNLAGYGSAIVTSITIASRYKTAVAGGKVTAIAAIVFADATGAAVAARLRRTWSRTASATTDWARCRRDRWSALRARRARPPRLRSACARSRRSSENRRPSHAIASPVASIIAIGLRGPCRERRRRPWIGSNIA